MDSSEKKEAIKKNMAKLQWQAVHVVATVPVVEIRM